MSVECPTRISPAPCRSVTKNVVVWKSFDMYSIVSIVFKCLSHRGKFPPTLFCCPLAAGHYLGIGYRGLLSARCHRPILALFLASANLRATNTGICIYEGLVVGAKLILAYNAGFTSFVQCIPAPTRMRSAIRAQDLASHVALSCSIAL